MEQVISVLLLVPDYLANQFGQDTYLVHVCFHKMVNVVKADGGPLERGPVNYAVRHARIKAAQAFNVDVDAGEDFHVLFVGAGKLIDYSALVKNAPAGAERKS